MSQLCIHLVLTLHPDTCALRMAQVRSNKITRLQWYGPMMFWKVCTNLGYVSLSNSKTVLELYDMEIHQNINAQLSKVEDNQKFRLRKFDARHGKIGTGAVVKNRKELIGIERRKRYMSPVERKKATVRRETSAVSGKRVTIVSKTRPQCRHTFRAILRSVSKKRSIQGKSNHGAILRQPCRIYLKRHLHSIALWTLASTRVSILQNRNGLQSRG